MSEATAATTTVIPAEWLSAHLFLGADIYGAAADAVARDVVAPVVARGRAEGWMLGYFFIRYGELGPHLRLRLRVRLGEAPAVAELLRAHVRAIAPAADLPPFEVAEAPRDNVAAVRTWPDTPLVDDPRVAALWWIPYVPEVDRYGGPAAIGVAERVFEASSDAALALLDGLGAQSRAGRLGRALLAMLVTAHACFDGRAAVAAFARRYGTGYLRAAAGGAADRVAPWERAFAQGFTRQAGTLAAHVEAAWACLHDGGSLPGLDAFAAALSDARTTLARLCAAGAVVVPDTPARTWAACAPYLVPSFAHMTNNRLGVTIPEEAYLAHLLHWTLGRSGPATALAAGDPATVPVAADALDSARPVTTPATAATPAVVA